MKHLKRLFPVGLLCLVLLLCGSAAADESAGPVIFEGVTLASGRLVHGDVEYIRLSEAASALGVELRQEGGVFSFDWRKSAVSLSADSALLRYRDEDFDMQAPALAAEDGSDLLVPIYAFCDGAQIGVLFDEEYDTLYCTAAAGNWEIPQGYDVPVMMYHGVAYHPSENANLLVDPEKVEEQFCYLLDNGYSPIWFSDIEHIEDYEKPVILTFDDGWENNYTKLFPLVLKYRVKITIFVVCSFFENSTIHLTTPEALEMQASGLVSFQSHAISHEDLTWLSVEEQEREIRESRLILTRKFGRIPYALAYPIGGSNPKIEAFTRQNYRFGIKMVAPKSYNTSDDPMRVWRFWPQRLTTIDEYKWWLEKTFRDKTA